jgi:hypothetical protein
MVAMREGGLNAPKHAGGRAMAKPDRKCPNASCPRFRETTRLAVCPHCHRATARTVFQPHPGTPLRL